MLNGMILLAEDNDLVRSFVCSVLQRHGYRVIEANDGAAALDLARRVGLDEIDLVLTDVDMPALSGTQLARCLKRLRPDLKILYMTGDTGVHVNELCREGAVIEKPFGYGTLVRAVDTCLSQVRPVRAGV